MVFQEGRFITVSLLAVVLAVLIFSGCGNTKNSMQGGAVQVKAMKVVQQDAPLSAEYAGQVKGKDEVKVQAKVSGTVVEKYVRGGEQVRAGQALYKIDSRQYESSVLSAQAELAKANASLSNAQTDLGRDQELWNQQAISEQTLTTQQSNVDSYRAAAAADAALLQKAQENLADTVVYAPLDGKLSVDDVAVGTYASAGSTSLVTIGSANPVFVQFSISETEYLKLQSSAQGGINGISNAQVNIVLSDGKEYPFSGRIVQADRALSENTGTLTVKALFDNPNGILLPGMFARVRLTGDVVPNALLIPQRAVQQLLDKSFVIVVGPDGKSQSKMVTLGDKLGSYYIIKDGLSAGDTVVVEGLTSLQEGKDLDVTMVTPEEMKFSFTTDTAQKTTDSASKGQS